MRNIILVFFFLFSSFYVSSNDFNVDNGETQFTVLSKSSTEFSFVNSVSDINAMVLKSLQGEFLRLSIPSYGSDSTSLEQDSGSPFRPYTFGAWGDYGYYKILLGNENLGGAVPVPDVSSLSNAGGSTSTKGLLIGFTRDPVIYRDDFIIPGPNTDPGQNIGIPASSTVASSCFFIAPTMGFDGSSVEFVPITACANSEVIKYNKMIVKDDLEVWRLFKGSK